MKNQNRPLLSLRLALWLHLGHGATLGPEIPGPVIAFAQAAHLPLDGPPCLCEQCERILPYAELWRSLTTPSRAYCEGCLAGGGEAVGGGKTVCRA